jgi:putative tryptophan/tyrosine transport system substrate-binding protein
VTGVTNLIVELASKQLGLLRDLVHGTTAITVLTNPHYLGTEKQLRDAEAAARVLGLQLIVLRASSERELETVFATMAQQSPSALLVSSDPFFVRRCDQIVGLAARHAIRAMYSEREFAVAGGLMSYGPNFAVSYREAGIYTGRILKGEKSADLPVQQSTRFEFVINLKTANALGIEVPLGLVNAADEVIE